VNKNDFKEEDEQEKSSFTEAEELGGSMSATNLSAAFNYLDDIITTDIYSSG